MLRVELQHMKEMLASRTKNVETLKATLKACTQNEVVVKSKVNQLSATQQTFEVRVKIADFE